MMEMTQENIDEIVDLFKESKVWNDGKFSKAVELYCNEKELDYTLINSKLAIAFRDYLATNITSENAIRFRLSQTLPKNAAL